MYIIHIIFHLILNISVKNLRGKYIWSNFAKELISKESSLRMAPSNPLGGLKRAYARKPCGFSKSRKKGVGKFEPYWFCTSLSINHSSSYVLKNHSVSRTNHRNDGKISYLHENINDLKIFLFASHELK